MSQEKFKWADAEQAADRLTGCFVTFNGRPVKISQVTPGPEGIEIYYHDQNGIVSRVSALDDGWADFRIMPRLGWININDGKGNYTGVHLSRLPARHRKHGLTRENVQMASPDRNLNPSRSMTVDSILFNSGYLLEEFIPVSDIIENALDREAYAISPSYGIYRDGAGLFWLYRHMQRLGVVTEDAGLRLFPKTSYVSDEIAEDMPSVFSRVEVL